MKNKKLLDNHYYRKDLAGPELNGVIAKRWGVHESTVLRHRRKLGMRKQYYQNPVTGSYTVPIEKDATTGSFKKPKEPHITGHKESSDGSAEYTVSHSKQLTLADADEWVRKAGKDPEDYNISVYTTAYGNGLWSNRITASPKRKLPEQVDIPRLSKEEVEDIFKEYYKKEIKLADQYKNGTQVFLLADPQIGKVSSGKGTLETLLRIRGAAEKFANHLREAEPEEVLIVDMGDPIEGIFNVQNKQLSTNDLDLVDQVTTYRRLIIELIMLFSTHAKTIKFISVTSNHGEVRVARGATVGSVHNDWGIEINRQVADAISLSPISYKVECIVPDDHEITVRYETVDGTVLAFNHGDKASSGNTVGKWVSGQIAGEQPGHDAAIWFVAHYHNAYVLQVANKKWLIGCPSCDNGSDYFTHRTGETAVSGILAVDIRKGMWHNLRIL